MLILSRRAEEKIRVGNDVSIAILDVSGNQVKIGIDAPENVSVHREEIYQKVQAEKNTCPESIPILEGNKKPRVMTTNLNGTKVKVKRSFSAATQSFPSDSNIVSPNRKFIK